MAEIVQHRPVATTPVVLTEPEVARVLRVSDRTVRRWAAAGTLNAIKVGGVRRYRVDQVVALIDPPSDNERGGESREHIEREHPA